MLIRAPSPNARIDIIYYSQLSQLFSHEERCSTIAKTECEFQGAHRPEGAVSTKSTI